MEKLKSPSFVKGFKYRIYPTKKQELYLINVFGCCRFVYNRLLSETFKRQKSYFKHPFVATFPNQTAFYFSYRLTSLKQESDKLWLNEVSSKVLQQSVMNLGIAFQNHKKNDKGKPQFKKKTGKQSATYTNQAYEIIDGKLRLAKCDSLFKVKWHRDLSSHKPGNLTISKTSSGKYYVSFTCEYEPKQTSGQNFTGIDAGLTDLATLSNSETIDNPRHFKKLQHKLANAQRAVSRKKKGSNNRKKAVVQVARIHERIANQRSDYLHQLTTSLIRDNQAIAIERLAVSNMVKNRKLAKHIMDAGWGMMREQLKYKAVASQHCVLVLADPFFPSTNLCSHCGRRPKQKLKLNERKWVCEFCGKPHQRDHNAALNLEILARSQFNSRAENGTTEPIMLCHRYVDHFAA